MEKPIDIQNQARTAINQALIQRTTIRPGSILDRLDKRAKRRTAETFDSRTRRCLRLLENPNRGFNIALAVRALRRSNDVLRLESALLPGPLRLQMRLVELVPSHPELRRFVAETSIEPVRRLFYAVLAQALSDGATRILFDFAPETGEGIVVDYFIDSAWMTAMTAPSTLRLPVRGYLRRVETAGCRRLVELMDAAKSKLPDDIEMTWETPDRVVIDLIEVVAKQREGSFSLSPRERACERRELG